MAHRWGEEIYFDIPVDLELENGKEVLDVGDIAYSAVSVFGKIIGDARIFRTVKEGERIRVEAVN